MKTGCALIMLVAGLGVLGGCGGPTEAEVSGTVYMDGKPLKEGDIIFEEMDKSKTPAAGKIADGKFTLKVTPGSKIVRVNASRPTKKPDPVMGSAAKEEMIAKEYNELSILKAEIKGKTEDLRFEVKSIP